MEKLCLFWKPVTCQNIRGLDRESRLPEIISRVYRGNLFHEIHKMPRKEPISFAKAVQILSRKRIEFFMADQIGSFNRCTNEFVQFISECGYHIELSGDEFVFHLSKAESH